MKITIKEKLGNYNLKIQIASDITTFDFILSMESHASELQEMMKELKEAYIKIANKCQSSAKYPTFATFVKKASAPCPENPPAPPEPGYKEESKP